MARPLEDDEPLRRRRPPARTSKARERQLINAAIEYAEWQIENKTAAAQVTVHYLKLATTKEQLEKEKLIQENKLLKAKVESLASMQRVEELYKNALDAMRAYSGHGVEEDDND